MASNRMTLNLKPVWSKQYVSCSIRHISMSNKLCSTTKESLSDGETSQFDINNIEDMAKAIKCTPLEQFREDVKPFMKELFVGNFWKKSFAYPDILTNDRYFHLNKKIKEIKESLVEKKHLIEDINTNERVSKDILTTLRTLGLFELRTGKKYELDGECYNLTESLRMMEEVAKADLNISNIIINSSWYGAETIKQSDNENLKEKYLSRIYNGNSVCALCITDPECGSDADLTVTEAAESPDGNFILNGVKSWVTNAVNADIFIVWAHLRSLKNPAYESDDIGTLSAFIVDIKESSGINVNKEDLYSVPGLKGCGITNVEFNNVEIPAENRLCPAGEGSHLRTESLKEEAKLVNSVQVLAGLRNVVSNTIQHASLRRAFGSYLNSFDMVKQKIGESCAHLYALESTIYMTAGLADIQKNPDFCVEASACKLLAIETSRIIGESSKLLHGANTYLSNHPISQILDNIEGLNWWIDSEDLHKLYIGLVGLSYACEEREISMARKVFYKVGLRKNVNDIHFDTTERWVYQRRKKRVFSMNRPEEGEAFGRTPHDLFEHVHPSLVHVACTLEFLFQLFDSVVEHLLSVHGEDIQDKEIEVESLAKVSTYLYAMTSTIARASRSYSDGHPQSQIELNYAISYVMLMDPVVQGLLHPLNEKAATRVGSNFPYIVKAVESQGGYTSTHPLHRPNKFES